MPALYNLSGSHLLPDDFQILGLDRVQQNDDQWRAALTDTMQSFTKDKTAEFYTPKIDDAAWGWVTAKMNYIAADFDQPDTYKQTRRQARRRRQRRVLSRGGGAVFRADRRSPRPERPAQAGRRPVPARGHRKAVRQRSASARRRSTRASSSRATRASSTASTISWARRRSRASWRCVSPTAMFEPTWRREYIDHVQITAAETIGVEQRGAFYEPTGLPARHGARTTFSNCCA